jgi:hypothetical protein
VRWFVLSGRLDVRLSEILTRGLLDWWRWARLGLTSATALVLIGAPIWSMTAILLGRANSSGHEGLGVVILALAVALTPLMVALAWSATLSGSWLLGVGDRRSAVLSWIAGLRESLRRPVASAATLAAWAVPGMASMALPLVLGAELELIRVGVLATIVEIVTGVAGAFCWVGLFLSFAPVTGLASTEKPVNEASDPKTR